MKEELNRISSVSESDFSDREVRNQKILQRKYSVNQLTSTEKKEFAKEVFDIAYKQNILSKVVLCNGKHTVGAVILVHYWNMIELDKIKSIKLRRLDKHTSWNHAKNTVGFPIESIRMKQKAIKDIKDNVELLAEYGIVFEPKSKLIYRKNSFDNNITFIKGKAPKQEVITDKK